MARFKENCVTLVHSQVTPFTSWPAQPTPTVTRILVVEDEHDIAGLIKHTLEREPGTRVDTVSSGDAALKAVADEAPDLVVLDRDPLETPADELGEIQVVATMVGGRWAHRPPPWDS